MASTDLIFVKVNNENLNILKNLAQAYEAEFSNLTHKMPDESGFFKIDTLPDDEHTGYILFYQKYPVGFCIANVKSAVRDIAEFYIVPVMRKKNMGYALATMIFNEYPGKWQVRQINGATNAIHFWRKVIGKFTQNNYEEAIIQDDHWGMVTRQLFHVKNDDLSNQFLSG